MARCGEPASATMRAGLAALLSVLRMINTHGINTVGDLMWVATVGEEELGNLRGVKALFRDHQDIDGFVAIDGLRITRLINQAIGSRRYQMIFKGPGGHSFAEFGRPSAIHAMGARSLRSRILDPPPIRRRRSQSAQFPAAPRSMRSPTRRAWRSTFVPTRSRNCVSWRAK
jgi:hypothetical protein